MIFVFGSNLGGRHGKGAALTAMRFKNAEYGVAEGPTGNSYALPTCDHRFKGLPLDHIQTYVNRFIMWARANPQMTFQVTRVGCGLALYSDKDIAPLFMDAPKENCFFDIKWKPWLGNEFEYWGTF